MGRESVGAEASHSQGGTPQRPFPLWCLVGIQAMVLASRVSLHMWTRRIRSLLLCMIHFPWLSTNYVLGVVWYAEGRSDVHL